MRNHDIAAVIGLAAFVHPEVTRRYLHRLRLPHLFTVLVTRYVESLIEYRFAAIAPITTVCRVPCPVPLVHGRDDETVPVDDARRIVARCRASQTRILEISGARHDSTDQIQR